MPIRPLKPEDIPIVAAIAQESMPHPWSENVFRDCLKSGYYSWIFTLDNEPIGFVIILLKGEDGELMNIAIKSAYRRKGYAQLLVQHAMDFARSKGVARLLLEVRRSNEAAIQFYEKLGAWEMGVRKDYYPLGERREDAVVFCLSV